MVSLAAAGLVFVSMIIIDTSTWVQAVFAADLFIKDYDLARTLRMYRKTYGFILRYTVLASIGIVALIGYYSKNEGVGVTWAIFILSCAYVFLTGWLFFRFLRDNAARFDR